MDRILYTPNNEFRKSFTGDYCQTKIQFCSKDFDPCHNGAKCVDHTTHYTCECLLGFSGDNCTVNNDDCQNHMCQVKFNSRYFRTRIVLFNNVSFVCFFYVERWSVRGRYQRVYVQVHRRLHRKILRYFPERCTYVPADFTLSTSRMQKRNMLPAQRLHERLPVQMRSRILGYLSTSLNRCSKTVSGCFNSF